MTSKAVRIAAVTLFALSMVGSASQGAPAPVGQATLMPGDAAPRNRDPHTTPPAVGAATAPSAPHEAGPRRTTLVVWYEGHHVPPLLSRALHDLQAEGRIAAIDVDCASRRIFVLGHPCDVEALADVPGVLAVAPPGETPDNPTETETGDTDPSVKAPLRTEPLVHPSAPAAVTGNGIITGVVTADDGGDPLEAVSVVAYQTVPYVRETTDTDASGVYSITVPAGTYRLAFEPHDYHIGEYYDDVPKSDASSHTPVEITSGTTMPNVNASLAPGARVLGRVTDEATDDPVPSIQVSVDSEPYTGYYAYGYTNSSGVYTTTPGLPPGTYEVSFFDHRGDYAVEYFDDVHAPSQHTPVTVTNTDDVGDIDAALSPAAVITGVVTGSGPLPGIHVTAYYSDSNTYAEGATTDASGRYRLGSMGPTTYKLQFVDYDDVFVTEWHDDKADWATADPVRLTAGMTTTVNAELTAGGVVAGTVTDEDSGSPLQGISVSLSDAATGGYVSGLTTDAGGAYRFAGLVAGDYVLRFRDYDDRYLEEYYDDQPHRSSADPVSVTAGMTTTVNAELTAGGVIAGTVTEEGSGSPLEGIRVNLYEAVTDGYYGTTSTDGAGFYRFGALTNGTYHLHYQDLAAHRYLPEHYDDRLNLGTADPVTVTLGVTTTANTALAVGGFISGRVTDADSGGGIAGVSVGASRQDDDTPDGWATTSADGTYTTTALYTGVCEVRFDPPAPYYEESYDNHQAGQDLTPISVTIGTTTGGIDADLTVGHVISGTVTGAEGAPLEHVRVQAYEETDSWASETSYTDGSGKYQLGPLRPATYRVFFEPQDNHVGEWYQDAPSHPDAQALYLTGHLTDVDAELDLGARITGTVTGPDGLPVNDVDVSVYAVGREEDVASATTDAQGRYATDPGLAPGSYEVEFDAPPGYTSVWYDQKRSQDRATTVSVTGTTDRTNVDAVLSTYRSGTITGTVTTIDTGQPYSIWVYAHDANGRRVRSDYASGGAYVLEALPPGNYWIYFSGRSPYVPVYYGGQTERDDAQPVTVEADATISNLNQAVPRGGAITGQVTGSGGIPGVLVSADQMDGSDSASSYSSPDGTYRIEGLQAGTYEVQFRPPPPFIGQWYQGATDQDQADTVAVELDATTPDIEAALLTGGTISGTISATDTGAPLPGAYTEVYSGTTRVIHPVYADMDGVYHTPGLPAGDYYLRFRAGQWSRYVDEWYDGASSAQDGVTVTVPSGGTTLTVDAALERGGTISGWTYDATTGHLLESVYANVLDISGHQIAYDYSNDFGFYQVDGLEGGHYYIRFRRTGYYDQWYDEADSREGALTVTVASPSEVTGINVIMVPEQLVYLPLVIRIP